YTPPSSARSYTTLSHFLCPQFALPHTAVIVVLDGTGPWSFLEDLNPCLVWIEHCVQGDGARELEVIYGEHHE
ncbi:hypothetical protein DFH94DRAFT_611128, partial [Russula ochroleuca]